ncbi:MAG: cysteine synthase family protein [Planctomycetes bacterium]|nr:cysteine synthase family protein [Planctomycetota bacterium]MCB9884351.1 cysteine synthase family protein [Planctomycetota bacterium]
MARIAADVTWLIGNTPLVELARLSPAGTRILGKVEAGNPSGSNKDRAALGMIRHAERSGFLREGGTIVECSGGDLGLAIALVGRRLGYRVVLTMPEWLPESRRSLLRALQAEVVTTPTNEGMQGAMQRADQIAKQTTGAVCLQAFTNRANARHHAETTAREIWHDTDGKVGVVVVPVGTGGTAAGCASFLRELGVRVIGVEPAGSPVLGGGKAGAHDIPGLGAGFVPDILCRSELDDLVSVTDRDASAGVRALAREEGLLLGPASGAVIHAARHLAQQAQHAGQLMVAVLPDRADRYLEHQSMRQEA